VVAILPKKILLSYLEEAEILLEEYGFATEVDKPGLLSLSCAFGLTALSPAIRKFVAPALASPTSEKIGRGWFVGSAWESVPQAYNSEEMINKWNARANAMTDAIRVYLGIDDLWRNQVTLRKIIRRLNKVR